MGLENCCQMRFKGKDDEEDKQLVDKKRYAVTTHDASTQYNQTVIVHLVRSEFDEQT